MSSTLPPAPQAPPPSLAGRVLRELNHGSVGWAVGLAVTVALILNPFYGVPFMVLLGRTLFVALVLVLVFHGVGLWRQRWMPRWLAQTLGVALAAPAATALVYLVATSGDVARFIGIARLDLCNAFVVGAARGIRFLEERDLLGDAEFVGKHRHFVEIMLVHDRRIDSDLAAIGGGCRDERGGLRGFENVLRAEIVRVGVSGFLAR